MTSSNFANTPANTVFTRLSSDGKNVIDYSAFGTVLRITPRRRWLELANKFTPRNTSLKTPFSWVSLISKLNSPIVFPGGTSLPHYILTPAEVSQISATSPIPTHVVTMTCYRVQFDNRAIGKSHLADGVFWVRQPSGQILPL